LFLGDIFAPAKERAKFAQALKHSRLVIKYSVQTGPFGIDAKGAGKIHFPNSGSLSHAARVSLTISD